MKQGQLLNIRILPHTKHPSFEQREMGVTHTPHLEEIAFYSQIQQGNTEMVRQMLGGYLTSAIVIGRLSENPVRQMQYWAVCCITLGIRYAIQGGLEEMQAFNLSDAYIMQVDKLASTQEITSYLETIVLELTELVRKTAQRNCPAPIRKCLNYIDAHLHDTISLADLAGLTGLSESYVSRFFKKHIGKTVKHYILEKKLETAKAMLARDCGQKEIAYDLGFCSQTYFITCFKRACGITPRQYAAGHGQAAQEAEGG